MMPHPIAFKTATTSMANTLPSKTTSSSGNGSGKAVLPRLLTVDAVAEQLGTSTKTVRRWIASGALHIHRLGTAAGMSKERWRNIRSLVRTALADRGATTGSGCGEARVPLSPEWDALFQLLADSMSRFRLSRFIRFCSNQGISPEAVDDATFNRFRDTLDATDLKNSPRQVARSACQFWNKAADTIPGWPQHHVTVPNYTRFYAVSWSRFPTSLTAEIDAWLARLAGTDPLDELPFRPLRESSIATRRKQLHEYASALVHAGHPPDSLRSMADLVEVDRVKDALRFIINRKRELGVAVAGAAHLNAASVGGK